MSARDTERLLVEVLHRHAEEAMTQTDTPTEHDRLYVGRDPDDRGARRPTVPAPAWWSATLVAAAVAAVIATGTTLWVAGRTDTGPEAAPAGQDAGTATATERDLDADHAAAQGFVDAFMAGDTATAATYLAPGTEPWQGWVAQARRNTAWLLEYDAQPCEVVADLETHTSWSCDYAVAFLRSADTGLAPFRGNYFYVQVRDGAVFEASDVKPFESNGIQQYLEAVAGWLDTAHPADEKFLLQEEQEVRDGEWDRYARLWDRYSREYVDRARP